MEKRLLANQSRRSLSAGSRSRLFATLRTVDVGVREGKVGMIEEIEEACSYRQIRTLPSRDGKSLFDIKIGVKITGTAELVTMLTREGRRRVKPLDPSN